VSALQHDSFFRQARGWVRATGIVCAQVYPPAPAARAVSALTPPPPSATVSLFLVEWKQSMQAKRWVTLASNVCAGPCLPAPAAGAVSALTPPPPSAAASASLHLTGLWQGPPAGKAAYTHIHVTTWMVDALAGRTLCVYTSTRSAKKQSARTNMLVHGID
jgi:hypothetical protein